MKKKKQLSYTRAVVIVHGKSEKIIVDSVKSNLHLSINVHSRDSGDSSIQINCLTDELKHHPFNNKRDFVSKYQIDEHKGLLVNFKLFIIMDTDDCNDITFSSYKDKSLFDGHWLKDYIVPIYNSPSLEYVLYKAKIIDKIFNNNEIIRNFSIFVKSHLNHQISNT